MIKKMSFGSTFEFSAQGSVTVLMPKEEQAKT
jgi:hypothetical protein